ncbi:MAG: hypothetical protein Q9167_003168 [Letrouitia subvulpina]
MSAVILGLPNLGQSNEGDIVYTLTLFYINVTNHVSFVAPIDGIWRNEGESTALGIFPQLPALATHPYSRYLSAVEFYHSPVGSGMHKVENGSAFWNETIIFLENINSTVEAYLGAITIIDSPQIGLEWKWRKLDILDDSTFSAFRLGSQAQPISLNRPFTAARQVKSAGIVYSFVSNVYSTVNGTRSQSASLDTDNFNGKNYLLIILQPSIANRPEANVAAMGSPLINDSDIVYIAGTRSTAFTPVQVNGTALASIWTGFINMPTTRFPFKRLASIPQTNESLSYLYHQLDETVIAEEIYDAQRGVFTLTNNITIETK